VEASALIGRPLIDLAAQEITEQMVIAEPVAG
jgi:hypothetical protein